MLKFFLLFTITLLALSCSNSQQEFLYEKSDISKDWQKIRTYFCSIEAPKNFSLKKENSTDSFICTLTNKKNTIQFDYGYYSPFLENENEYVKNG